MSEDRKTQMRQGVGGSETEAALDELERAADELKIPAIGAEIGDRYTVTEELGHGAYGWVFGVRHQQLGQRFALKVLIPRIATDPEWVARFREEARATSLIGHENIVFVTDFGHDREYGEYLVMEYLDGMALDDLLRRNEVQPLDRTIRFAIAAGSALSAVHELGIVHCDLKPSNVFMVRQEGAQERWKIIDFGTSTFVLNAVESDKLFGTPRYMAPEQAAGRFVDHRADQFSLACILHEMLTGRLPWRTDTWSDALPEARRANPPVAPSVLSKNCPAALDKILGRALSVNPIKRYGSVEEFVEELQSVVDIDATPSADPFDARPTSNEFERSFTAPRVTLPSISHTTSIQIGIESNPFTALPVIKMMYTNAARLRREYRRNLIAGLMFVPSDEVLPQGTRVAIRLGYEPNSTWVELTGTVMESQEENGFGVRVDVASRKPLTKFLNTLRLGFGFVQNDMLVRTSHSNIIGLTAAQAFVLSKLGSETRVSSLRAECNGLPLGFEETVSDLVAAGHVQLYQSGAGDSSSLFFAEESIAQHLADDSSVFDQEMSDEEIAQVLEKVLVFKEVQNYLAAINVLQSAIEIASTVAEFHYQLASLYEAFEGDTGAAIEAIDRAILLAPDNQTYRGFRLRL